MGAQENLGSLSSFQMWKQVQSSSRGVWELRAMQDYNPTYMMQQKIKIKKIKGGFLYVFVILSMKSTWEHRKV